MGIVPMKPPNRRHEGVAAEVVEGRLVTEENKMKVNTCPTLSGPRVNQGFMEYANQHRELPGD